MSRMRKTRGCGAGMRSRCDSNRSRSSSDTRGRSRRAWCRAGTHTLVELRVPRTLSLALREFVLLKTQRAFVTLHDLAHALDLAIRFVGARLALSCALCTLVGKAVALSGRVTQPARVKSSA